MCDCEEVQDKNPYLPVQATSCSFDVFLAETWTPHQHHVQSWIWQYGNCDYRLLMDFSYWCESFGDAAKGRSLEEMWLMYYMWREHYKTWDGEKWVKI